MKKSKPQNIKELVEELEPFVKNLEDPRIALAYNNRNTKEFCNTVAKSIRYELQRWPHRNILMEDPLPDLLLPHYECPDNCYNINLPYVYINKQKQAKKAIMKRVSKEIPIIKTSVSISLKSSRDILYVPGKLARLLAEKEMQYLIKLIDLGKNYGTKTIYFMDVKDALRTMNINFTNPMDVNQVLKNMSIESGCNCSDCGTMLHNILTDKSYIEDVMKCENYYSGKFYTYDTNKAIIGFCSPEHVGVIPLRGEVEVTNKGNKYTATLNAGYALFGLQSIIVANPTIIKHG